MVLAPWKLKQPKSPKVPTCWPLIRASRAWAQSSTTFSPCSRAISRMAGMSQGMPSRWTQTMALVLGVIFRRMSSGSMVQVSRSMSPQTILAPALPKGMAEAQKV